MLEVIICIGTAVFELKLQKSRYADAQGRNPKMGLQPPVLLVHHARKGVTSRTRAKQKAEDSKISKCHHCPRGSESPLLLPKLLSQETTGITLFLKLCLVLVLLSLSMVDMISFFFLPLTFHTF